MNSKLTFCALIAALLMPFLLLTPARSQGQADEVPAEVVALIAEIQKQQASIAANQEQIDAKLATIAEDIRLARIFVSRGGPK
jgi:hypothetical protein